MTSSTFRRRFATSFVLVLSAFNALSAHTLGAAANKSPDITGSFKINGKGDDGKTYEGTATVRKIGGEMYNATWTIAEASFTGICFRDADDLSCAWSNRGTAAHGLLVMAYLVKRDTLDGVFFESGGTTLGKEILTLKMKGTSLEGVYTIAKGKNADGSAYSGTCAVKQLSPTTFAFQWTISGLSQHGIGIRNSDAGRNDVISAALTDIGNSVGAMQYHVDKTGNVLTGHRLHSINGKVFSGMETMTKAGA
jgi:hypothetical protein